jgi:hypothetical protein
LNTHLHHSVHVDVADVTRWTWWTVDVDVDVVDV